MKYVVGTRAAHRYGTRMRQFIPAFIAIVLPAMLFGQQNDPPSTPPDLPPAAVLRQSIIAHLPQKAVALQARLTSKAGKGFTLNVKIRLDAAGEKVGASYQVDDAFGNLIGKLDLARDLGAAPRYTFHGPADAKASAPDLFRTIGPSDIYWLDLALGFIWWTNGRTIGRQEMRSRDCYVVDLYAPDPATALYSTVRAWVDEKYGMLVQAEAYDRAGDLARRVVIKSIKKVGDDWMVKDIELRSMPGDRKTFLRVDKVEVEGKVLPEDPE